MVTINEHVKRMRFAIQNRREIRPLVNRDCHIESLIAEDHVAVTRAIQADLFSALRSVCHIRTNHSATVSRESQLVVDSVTTFKRIRDVTAQNDTAISSSHRLHHNLNGPVLTHQLVGWRYDHAIIHTVKLERALMRRIVGIDRISRTHRCFASRRSHKPCVFCPRGLFVIAHAVIVRVRLVRQRPYGLLHTILQAIAIRIFLVIIDAIVVRIRFARIRTREVFVQILKIITINVTGCSITTHWAGRGKPMSHFPPVRHTVAVRIAIDRRSCRIGNRNLGQQLNRTGRTGQVHKLHIAVKRGRMLPPRGPLAPLSIGKAFELTTRPAGSATDRVGSIVAVIKAEVCHQNTVRIIGRHLEVPRRIYGINHSRSRQACRAMAHRPDAYIINHAVETFTHALNSRSNPLQSRRQNSVGVFHQVAVDKE